MVDVRRGFSIVELMVVVGILLILAGLLLPVVASARRSAKVRVCAARLAQCSHGIMLYAADADGLYPAAKDGFDRLRPASQPARVGSMPLLADAVFPYTRSREIFQCPQDVGLHVVESAFPEALELSPSAFAASGMSYEYRTDLGASLVSDTRLERPAEVNLLADMAGHWHGSTRALTKQDNFDGYSECIPGYRYDVLFADGHVRLLGHSEMEGAWKRG